jgi:hypothetical protein
MLVLDRVTKNLVCETSEGEYVLFIMSGPVSKVIYLVKEKYGLSAGARTHNAVIYEEKTKT